GYGFVECDDCGVWTASGGIGGAKVVWGDGEDGFGG
ncbi:hypothetical protein A2U01_0081651, partial [Trifolium medium]|nr:hypothetical protein [Trifolium medium]